MGSVTEQAVSYGKTAEEAIDSLVSDAIYDYGHEAYSGSIATCTNGTREGYLDQKKFTPKAINRWTIKWFDELQKREIIYLELPKSHAKGMGRGIKKFIVIYCGAC